MEVYRYTVIDNSTKGGKTKTGIGTIFGLSTAIPMEIITVLELLQNESGAVSIKIESALVSPTLLTR